MTNDEPSNNPTSRFGTRRLREKQTGTNMRPQTAQPASKTLKNGKSRPS